MINLIPIIIDERGNVKKDIQILAMENENLSKRFSISLPNSIKDKWLYIEFENADGDKFVTEKLTAVSNYLEYDITDQLTVKGKLICQVVAKNGDQVVWKSNLFDFTISKSINATERVAASNFDILTDLQRQIDNIGTGGSVDLTNYYTKEEVDNKISEIPNDEVDLTNYYTKEETYSQLEVNNLISNIPTGSSTTIPVVRVEGSSVTLEPNKHYVIDGVTNRLTISLAEAIETELKHYSFEFTSVDRIPTVTINGVDQPYNYEYEKNTKYLCEIVNNHLVILGTYDGYEYQFVYGVFATSDWTSSYNLKNDRTFIETASGATRSGTYQVEYSSNLSQYVIYLTFEGGDFKSAYWSEDGTITIDGVVYTKS